MGRFLGTCAALSAPLLMTIGFVIWDKVWTGSAVMLNVVKCSLATVVFILVAAVISRSFQGSVEDVMMLILSSLLGITIGDNAWLYALQVLGPRKVIVCDSLKPFLAAVLGSLFLDEGIKPFYILGIALTTLGVLAISLEKSNNNDANKADQTAEKISNNDDNRDAAATKGVALQEKTIFCARHDSVGEKDVTVARQARRSNGERSAIGDGRKRTSGNNTGAEEAIGSEFGGSLHRIRTLHLGYACAIANVIFDVFGSFLTRLFGQDMTTFDINSIRFGSAAVLLNIVTLSVRALYMFESRKAPNWTVLPSTLSRREWSLIVLGVLFVTVGCPALSNYALFEIPLGMCLTLTSVGPIYALPLTYISKKEPVSWRCFFGACAASSGVAVLYLI